jgi:hypothetical protein
MPPVCAKIRYDFDPIGLTESGEKLISLAKELEELTGHRITLKMMIRLIFEREYDGFINNAEAAGRGYWDWAQNKYGIHTKATLVNWVGVHESADSLYKDILNNLPNKKNI